MLTALALLLTLAAPPPAEPTTPGDADLARAIRHALVDAGSGRLVSREGLAIRARGGSDLQLARSASATIRDALGDDLRGLMVSASGGVVELRGDASPAAAEQAVRLAARLPGVVGVRSTLGGQSVELEPLPIADPFSFATDTLLGGAALSVRVDKGIVHLSGTVNGQAARRFVVEAARGVRGVRGVVDDLAQREVPLGNDLGLVGVLRRKLGDLPELAGLAEHLELTVRAGVVAVSGSVGSDLQRELIEVTLLATHGVLVVVSDLQPGAATASPSAPVT